MPEFRADLIIPLLPSAFTVAMLAAVESLLSAVVADGMSGDKHNSNVELVAQGMANLVSPLRGRHTGHGGDRAYGHQHPFRRQDAGGGNGACAHLAVDLVSGAPLARFIPLATLAAVLFVVAYNMGEWREIGAILKLSKADKAVWLTTFALTVLADLTVAVEVGMVLAALLYIYRVSQTTTVATITDELIENGRPHILQDKCMPDYVTILRIRGPFLFGTTEKLAEETPDVARFAPVVILRLRHMMAIDATGLHAIEMFAKRIKQSGRVLLLCGARDQPAEFIEQSDFLEIYRPRKYSAPCTSRA